MERSIAIIPARGGSKRIPKKNIKEFCGKPVISYSIKAALESACFDEVMVSTDDRDIAEMAIKMGAKVPFFRSKENSDDFSVTTDVLREVLEEYENCGKFFRYGCCIYSTAPFVTASKLKRAMNMLRESNADSVLPVVEFSFPPQRGVVIKNGVIEMLHPEHLNTRSQDLERVYHDCGQFYCFNINSFKEERKLLMNNTIPYILDELEAQDLDSYTDWTLAELKFKMKVD